MVVIVKVVPPYTQQTKETSKQTKQTHTKTTAIIKGTVIRNLNNSTPNPKTNKHNKTTKSLKSY